MENKDSVYKNTFHRHSKFHGCTITTSQTPVKRILILGGRFCWNTSFKEASSRISK